MPPTDLALMALVGLLAGTAHIFVVFAFKQAPPATVAPFQYTQMLWAVFYGFLLFGDIPDAYVISGLTLVTGSGLYILWREQVVRRRERRLLIHPPVPDLSTNGDLSRQANEDPATRPQDPPPSTAER